MLITLCSVGTLHTPTHSLSLSPQFINRGRGEGGSKSLLDQIILKTVCSDIKHRRLTSSRNIFQRAWILQHLLVPYTFCAFLLEVKTPGLSVCRFVSWSVGRFRLSVIIFPKEREVLFPCSYRSTCLHNVPEHKTHIKEKKPFHRIMLRKKDERVGKFLIDIRDGQIVE